MKQIFKNKRIIIAYFLTVLILLIGTTYALQSTSSGIFANTAIVRIDEESYGSSTFDTTSLKPILDKDVESSDNIIHIDFTVGGDKNNNRDNIIYDIALTDLNINCDLLSPYIKWKLVKNGKELSTGSLDYHFDTIVDGRLVLTTIQEDLPTYNENQQGYDKYNFYMWISDSCQSDNLIDCLNNPIDQSELLNKNLSGKIEVELYTDSKKELVRKPANELDTSICENKYLVEYDLNGGTSTTKSKYVTNGSSYGDLPTPTKKDITVTYNTGYEENINSNSISYTFDGWYLSNQYKTNELVTKDTTVTKLYNHKLYAKWNKSSSDITLPTLSREGYIFDGWYSDSKFTNKVGNGGEKYTVNENSTLYAGWEPNIYTINLDKNYLDNNLWTNTNNKDVYQYAVSSPKSITEETDSNINQKYLKFIMNSGTSGGIIYTPSEKLTVGKTYTWSIYIKTNSNKKIKIGSEQGGVIFVNTTNEWQKITQTFTASDTSYYAFILYIMDYADNNDVWNDGDEVDIHSFEIMEGVPNVSSIERSYGSKIGELETPTRVGYNFEGWYTKPLGGEKIESTTIMPNKDVTYYAHWSLKKVTVKFMRNYDANDTEFVTKTYTYGVSGQQFDSGFTRRGYEGIGWSSTATGEKIFDFTNGIADYWLNGVGNTLTLYAKWEADVYTIKFNGNGATSGSIADKTCIYDGACSTPTSGFSKTGYTFIGWTTKADGTDDEYGWSNWNGTWTYVDGQFGMSNKVLNLYAMWKANTYTIKFNGNGATSGSIADKTCIYNGACSTNVSGFSRTGYTFIGWTTRTDGADDGYYWSNWNGTWTYVDGQYGINNGKLVLYARWQAKTYTVTYRSNLIPNTRFTNGVSGWTTNGVSDITVDSNIKYNGINSLRISTSSNGYYGVRTTDTVSYKPNTKYRISIKAYRDSSSSYGDVTRIFRVYIPELKSDGTVLNYRHHVTIDTSNLPNKTWKEFSAEFTTDASAGVSFKGMYLDFNAEDGKSNIWITEPMVEEVQTRTVTTGTTLAAPPTVVRDNHTLAGWTTKTDGTDDGYNWSGWTGTWTYDNGQYGISNNNLILNARWNVNNYTLTVNPNGGSYNGSAGLTTYTQEYDSTRSLPNPTPPSYTVTFNANGGSVSTSSVTVTKTFSGWTKSGTGEYIAGSIATLKGNGVSRTQKINSSGVYDNYIISVSSSGSGSYWHWISYPTYSYTPDHVYDVRFKLQINAMNTIPIDIRHAAVDNDYGSTGRLALVYSKPMSLTPIAMTRTFNGTTIGFGGSTKTIAPQFEIYTSDLNGKKDTLNFDIRDMHIIDRNSLQLKQANANTFWFRKGNGTLTANYNEGSLSLPTPTRSGYTFLGWYTSLSGGTQITDINKNQITSTTTLYARWSILASTYVKNLHNDGSSISTAYIGGTTSNPSVKLNTKQGIMLDNNNEYRYYGATPNNYVKFNNELWRIIGVFNVKSSTSSAVEQRVKIIRNDSIGNYSWDSSVSSVNNGFGASEWTQADLNTLLNDYYYNSKTNQTCYNGHQNASTTCSFSNIGLSTEAKNLIGDTLWNLGGHDNDSVTTNSIYNSERGTTVYRCTSGVGCPRTTTWTGRIGLMYPSDYGYATDLSVCTENLGNYSNTNCKNNDWLFNSMMTWTLTPYISHVFGVYNVNSTGAATKLYNSQYYNCTSNALAVRPVVFLKSSIKIISGGEGTASNPYNLST